MGCQGLLEEIPGRRKDSLQLLLSSPGESKSLLRGTKSHRGTSKSYNVKEEMSSKIPFCKLKMFVDGWMGGDGQTDGWMDGPFNSILVKSKD